MYADGVDVELEQKLSKLSQKEKNKFQEQENQKIKKVPFGDLLRPIFSVTGEIKGVEFDS